MSAASASWTTKYVDDVITISEDPIRDGVRRLAADATLVAEPFGAVPFAAYLHYADQLGVDGNVVAIVSGGNIDMDTLAPASTANPAWSGTWAGMPG